MIMIAATMPTMTAVVVNMRTFKPTPLPPWLRESFEKARGPVA